MPFFSRKAGTERSTALMPWLALSTMFVSFIGALMYLASSFRVSRSMLM